MLWNTSSQHLHFCTRFQPIFRLLGFLDRCILWPFSVNERGWSVKYPFEERSLCGKTSSTTRIGKRFYVSLQSSLKWLCDFAHFCQTSVEHFCRWIKFSSFISKNTLTRKHTFIRFVLTQHTIMSHAFPPSVKTRWNDDAITKTWTPRWWAKGTPVPWTTTTSLRIRGHRPRTGFWWSYHKRVGEFLAKAQRELMFPHAVHKAFSFQISQNEPPLRMLNTKFRKEIWEGKLWEIFLAACLHFRFFLRVLFLFLSVLLCCRRQTEKHIFWPGLSHQFFCFAEKFVLSVQNQCLEQGTTKSLHRQRRMGDSQFRNRLVVCSSGSWCRMWWTITSQSRGLSCDDDRTQLRPQRLLGDCKSTNVESLLARLNFSKNTLCNDDTVSSSPLISSWDVHRGIHPRSPCSISQCWVFPRPVCCRPSVWWRDQRLEDTWSAAPGTD